MRGQLSFSDIRVFNPYANCYASNRLSSVHKIHEKEKKRSYNQRILETDHGSFTPLVFACTGGMSRECERFYSRLGELISEKKKIEKSATMGWLKAKLSFKLLRSANVCIRGSRSLKNADNSDVSNTDITFVNDIFIR